MNKIIQFFTDYRERKVNHPSFFYGLFTGMAMGVIFAITFLNLFAITIGSLLFLVFARLIFLKIELKEDFEESGE